MQEATLPWQAHSRTSARPSQLTEGRRDAAGSFRSHKLGISKVRTARPSRGPNWATTNILLYVSVSSFNPASPCFPHPERAPFLANTRLWDAWSNDVLETAHVVSVLAGGVWLSREPTCRQDLRALVCERRLAVGSASEPKWCAKERRCSAGSADGSRPSAVPSRVRGYFARRGGKPLVVPHPTPTRGGPPPLVKYTTHAEGLLSQPQGPLLSSPWNIPTVGAASSVFR